MEGICIKPLGGTNHAEVCLYDFFKPEEPVRTAFKIMGLDNNKVMIKTKEGEIEIDITTGKIYKAGSFNRERVEIDFKEGN